MSTYSDYKAANHYTTYTVKEPAELMQFLMNTISGISRTKAKEYLSQRMVYVNKEIITQYNYLLQPGQIVQVAKNRHKHAFSNPWCASSMKMPFCLLWRRRREFLPTRCLVTAMKM